MPWRKHVTEETQEVVDAWALLLVNYRPSVVVDALRSTDTGAGRPQPVAAEGSEKIQALPSAAPWSVDDDPR